MSLCSSRRERVWPLAGSSKRSEIRRLPSTVRTVPVMAVRPFASRTALWISSGALRPTPYWFERVRCQGFPNCLLSELATHRVAIESSLTVSKSNKGRITTVCEARRLSVKADSIF